jgi:hypothetical protein
MARKEDVFVKLAILGLPIKDWSLAILTALRHSSFSTYLTVGVHRFWKWQMVHGWLLSSRRVLD